MKKNMRFLGLLAFFLMSIFSAFADVEIANHTACDIEVWVDGNTWFTVKPFKHVSLRLWHDACYFSINICDERGFVGKVSFFDKSQVKDEQSYAVFVCASDGSDFEPDVLKDSNKEEWHLGLREKGPVDFWVRAVHKNELVVDESVLKKEFAVLKQKEQDKKEQKKLFLIKESMKKNNEFQKNLSEFYEKYPEFKKKNIDQDNELIDTMSDVD